jgi:SAM-dependent methyltransferase
VVLYSGRVSEPMWAPYDAMGRKFEQHAENGAANAHYDRPAVLAALGEVDGLQVLDAGCGPGFYSAELTAAGATVAAFDASETMLDLARARTKGMVRLDRAVLGEPMPYPDEEFDLIVCALAIHHASDRRAAFAEFYRVLKPGGKVVVSTSHPMLDWLSAGGSYFATELKSDIWKLASGNQEVRYWREPLSAVCGAATDAGFLISKLIEPMPSSTMQDLYPREYALLNAEPWFLILNLVKL